MEATLAPRRQVVAPAAELHPPLPHAWAPDRSGLTEALESADLDALVAHWRLALDTAEDALGSSATGMSRLSESELHLHRAWLAQERRSVACLLDAIARERHVRLRRSLSSPRATRRMLALPGDVLGCLFDLDGVLTASAELHAAAWAETFDEFLSRRAEHASADFAHFVRPFDPRDDYFVHLHGRPRLEGVRDFLASRGISLREGAARDRTDEETVHGLADRKNESLRRLLEREGVRAFEGSRRYLEAAREAGLRCAVVSPSANTEEILERAGLAELVEARVDGETIDRDHLGAKPAPDTLVAACRLLHVQPDEAAAFETTPAGIAAARTAGIRLVLGVDRAGRGGALREAGADVVTSGLAELLDPALAL